VAVLLAVSGQATVPDRTPDVLADGGVENVNAQVDALVQTGIVRRLLALTECAHSNSLIEAWWWRSLKHQWLFLHPLDCVATVRRLVTFYVGQHNRVIPHAAFHGRTPDERYFGTEGAASELPSRMAAARAARLNANRAASCPVCPARPSSGDLPVPA